MNSKTKNERLSRIAHKIALYLNEEELGTEQDWRDIIAEALCVIDRRSSLGWMRLARVNAVIEVTESGRQVHWRRGSNFKKYLSLGREEPRTQDG